MATALLQDFSAAPPADLAIDNMTIEQLLRQRERIDAALPNVSLKSVNIERELVLQLRIAQDLQKATLDDEMTPANLKAQCLNTASSALASLAKLQISVYDSERLKAIESILIECLGSLPTETQEAFFEQYEAKLRSAGV